MAVDGGGPERWRRVREGRRRCPGCMHVTWACMQMVSREVAGMLVPGGLPGSPDDGDGYGLLQVKGRGMVSKSSRRGPRLCREGEGERQ
jgi:hypothetical protein